MRQVRRGYPLSASVGPVHDTREDGREQMKRILVIDDETWTPDLAHNVGLMLPHEWRTPINGILAYGEILSAEAATLPPEEVAEMGQVIDESGKRLERLIENFLIYAQLELLGTDPQKLSALRSKRTQSPAELIERQARAQAHQANRDPDLRLDLHDQPFPISEDYLAKVVDEVVQNAFKFSEQGTQVCVELRDAPGSVTLVVSDRGRGFSTE